MNFYLISNLFELDWGLSWWTVVWWGGLFAALAHIPAVLLSRGGKPMAALAWILCLIALPIAGVILWWLMGRRHMERRKRRWERSQAEMVESLGEVRDTLVSEADAAGVQTRAQLPGVDERAALQPEVADMFSLHQKDGVFAATRGNRVHVFSTSRESYDAFERAIREAREHIHFQFYIWQNDKIGRHFRDLLIEKAREGVEVRVLFDAVGGAPVNRGFMRPLQEAGAQVAAFLPLSFFERQLRINFRNHRKIIVIDAQVGFTAGLNIGEEYLEWVDHAFEFDGPAVLQLQEVFAEDWYFATGEDLGLTRYFLPAGAPDAKNYALMSCHYTSNSLLLGERGSASTLGEAFVPRQPFSHSPRPDTPPASLPRLEERRADNSGPAHIADDATVRITASGPDKPQSVIKNVFFMAMTSAIKRIYLTTPYFVPDQAIMMAITTAALRGVDVRILTAGVTDVWLAREAGRSHYEELLEAGVRVYEYQDKILHAKSIVIDHRWSIVGSANMDIRSFELNFEVNAVVESLKITDYLAELFAEHLKRSREIVTPEFSKRPLKDRLSENTARLFSPLL